MRGLLAVLCGLSVMAGATASADAGGPARSKSFSGSGADYLNKGKAWKREGTGKLTFRTSTHGTRLLDFRGSYSYACAGGATLTAGFVTVAPSRKFDYAFSVREKTGIFYAQIYGHFWRGGKRAVVNYLVDFVPKGKKVAHPYDTEHPQSLGCASWVRGMAKAA